MLQSLFHVDAGGERKRLGANRYRHWRRLSRRNDLHFGCRRNIRFGNGHGRRKVNGRCTNFSLDRRRRTDRSSRNLVLHGLLRGQLRLGSGFAVPFRAFCPGCVFCLLSALAAITRLDSFPAFVSFTAAASTATPSAAPAAPGFAAAFGALLVLRLGFRAKLCFALRL